MNDRCKCLGKELTSFQGFSMATASKGLIFFVRVAFAWPRKNSPLTDPLPTNGSIIARKLIDDQDKGLPSSQCEGNFQHC